MSLPNIHWVMVHVIFKSHPFLGTYLGALFGTPSRYLYFNLFLKTFLIIQYLISLFLCENYAHLVEYIRETFGAFLGMD